MSIQLAAGLVAVGSAVAAILLVLPWPFRSERASDDAETQEARIRVKGGYEPDCIVVQAGLPVRLTFSREETAACSERVVFPDLGKSAMLPPFEDVAVELPSLEPGEHEFTCQMGVLHGWLIALPDAGAHDAQAEATTAKTGRLGGDNGES